MTGAILMICSLLINPRPFLVQSVIDSAKLIGLPRLKTMDHLFAKTIFIDELESKQVLASYSRKEFIRRYIQSNEPNSRGI